jgi:hypothetical protein
MPVVPDPANGSRTTLLPVSSSWVQVDSQPTVRDVAPTSCDRPPSFLPAPCPYSLAVLSTSAASRSTTRRHGAPHTPQHFGGDPARMHGSISLAGNVAKCAPAYGCVATVQTDRLLRPASLSGNPGPCRPTTCPPVSRLCDDDEPAG